MGKLTIAALLFVSGVAYAHPQHPAGDPAEPTGDEPPVPNVPGIEKNKTRAPVTKLTDEQLLALANEAAVSDETITIEDETPAESASSIHLDRDKLAKRSRTQMSDILRQVPGL